jgi:hypothetical protein
MIETFVVFVIVTGAAGWTLWNLGVRRWFRSRQNVKPSGSCGADCNCGD